MPRYLRSIRQSRWQPPSWAPAEPSDVQADALKDLATDGNLLSVYLAESPQDVDRITIALAATRDNLQNFDYAVFDDAMFEDTGITANKSSGHTPDQVVNQLHYDLGQLTARQALALTASIAKGVIRRRSRQEITAGLQQAIADGVLDGTALKQQLIQKLRQSKCDDIL